MLLLNVKFYPFILLILLVSCSGSHKVDDLILFNGVSEFTKDSQHNVAFLTNLKEYNNMMAMCYVNDKGELLKVYPIDKYSNIDVTMDFLKLSNNRGDINLFYENRGTDIIVKSFHDLSLKKTINLKRDVNSYGTIITIGNIGKSEFIKSSVFYNSINHESYKYNYFLLDESLGLLDSGIIDLGQFFPMGMLIINNKLFYYIDDRQLLFKSIKDGSVTSIYNFESDIVEVKLYNNSILVLLSDSIYIVTEEGKLLKGFTLLKNNTEYIAKSIMDTEDNLIVVELTSENNTIYKIFTFYGSQIGEYGLDDKSIGDSYILKSKNREILFYSTMTNLYLKVL